VIRALLGRQVTQPVQWEATLNTLLAKGLAQSVEVGPGKGAQLTLGGAARSSLSASPFSRSQ
jgi:malonyl CoA-acyl carrier protein transacylase